MAESGGASAWLKWLGERLADAHSSPRQRTVLLAAAAVAAAAAGATAGAYALHRFFRRKPRVLGVIPARWSSSRFRGKPLARILGRPMIQVLQNFHGHLREWQLGREALLLGWALHALPLAQKSGPALLKKGKNLGRLLLSYFSCRGPGRTQNWPGHSPALVSCCRRREAPTLYAVKHVISLYFFHSGGMWH